MPENLTKHNQNISTANSRRLAIIGGGLSGIAAAEYALRQGFQPEIFEWSGTLGGRLASFAVPNNDNKNVRDENAGGENAGNKIDNGQHIAMSCNTKLAALHKQMQFEKFFIQCPALLFVNQNGKQYHLRPSNFLPQRWKFLFSFLRFPFISFGDRIKTLSLLKELGQSAAEQNTGQIKKNFADFLAEHNVSAQNIEAFWSPLVLSSLCETPENVCIKAVADVVCGMFFSGSSTALPIQIPAVPLKSIYHTAVAEKFRKLGIPVHYFSRIKRLYWEDAAETENRRVFALESANGEALDFDYFILAVPIWRARDILNQSELEDYVSGLGLERFESGVVSTVHLFLNRPLLPVSQPAAVLLNGIGQFLVCHYPSEQNRTAELKHIELKHIELKQAELKPAEFKHTITISASHRLLSDEELTAKGSTAIVEKVLLQLSRSFPLAFSSSKQEPLKVLHSRVTTYFEAAFSPDISVYSERPRQQTPFCNFALAGDWTQTGLPATMEGAVISGQKAVDVLIKNCSGELQ